MTPAELAKQVRLLEIRTRHAVTEVFAGEYSSAFKGRGIEFAEVREYEPGDDVRTIDWNVTARTGKPFVKRFTEERELTVLLAVDLSASGDFGTQERSTRRLGVEAAAVLAFAAARKGDRVGIVLFTDRVELYIPPKKGPRHALRLIRELLAFEPKHRGTDLGAATEHIARVARRRAVVFVVSDFLVEGAGDALATIASRHDAIAVRVGDPRDRELAPAGMLEVRDPETGARALIDSSSRGVREAYAAAALEREDGLTATLRRAGVDEVELSTDREYVHDLVGLFHKREKRR
ncbi:MAG TPA: DUF58 domain-containing protein [Phycisphaerales bacterium]|nr:DUF58 domain-containing protein [Phycisphaerales bacterium]